MGMSIAQEGSPFSAILDTSTSVMRMLLKIEDVPSPDARNLLEKVRTYTLLKSLVATFTSLLIILV